MRTPILLTSPEGEGLHIELELDHERQRVTLHTLEFDADLVNAFLETLPQKFGISVGDPSMAPVPNFELVIALAGRHHPARLTGRGSSRPALRLGDPDAAYLVLCRRAIEQVLSSLHGLGIPAVVAGIDHYGRPEPDEGFLHLFALSQGEAEEQIVERLCSTVEAEHNVAICVLSSAQHPGDTRKVIAMDAHFAWDQETSQLVTRNWNPA